MTQTSNYGLSQWEKADRIQMENFNSDNAKIDAALKASADAVASHTTAIAKCGNCKLVYGTYTGTGNISSENPNQLNFDGKPMMVWVQEEALSSTMDLNLRMMRGCGWAQGAAAGNGVWVCSLTWGDSYVQWYNTSRADYQFNSKNKKYYYLALLDASV